MFVYVGVEQSVVNLWCRIFGVKFLVSNILVLNLWCRISGVNLWCRIFNVKYSVSSIT
jgi:hypothetical protein